MRHAFTLIELLIVIAIIATVAVVIVLVINPAQILMQARDSNRLSDLASLNSVLGIYLSQGGSSLGNANMIYVSIPDPSATSTAGDQCQGLGFPSAPSGTNYFCAASSSLRNTNGTGWIPVNLTTLAGGSPIGQLPVDPVNSFSSNLWYEYVTSGTQYEILASPESQKYSQTAKTSLVPGYFSQASSPFFTPYSAGLVGYWPMDEGSGSSTIDASGNGNTGSWNGASISGSHYTAGQVGGSAGNFDGSTDYVTGSDATFPSGSQSRSVALWMKTSNASRQIFFSYGAAGSGKYITVAIYPDLGSGFFVDTGPYSSSGGAIPNDGAWHQLVAVYAGGTTWQTYVVGEVTSQG